MKAVVLQEIGRVELMDVPVPTLSPDQLLIKTGAATICTSDLNDIRENPFSIELPVVIGHDRHIKCVGIKTERMVKRNPVFALNFLF